MTLLFRACIHATKIFDSDPLTKEQIEALSGFISMRIFGGDRVQNTSTTKRFMLFEFQLDNYSDIADINIALDSYKPAYCFNDICPRAEGDFQCPAVRNP